VRVVADILKSRLDTLGPRRLTRTLAGRRFDILLVEPGRNVLLLAMLARALTRARATASWIQATGKWGRRRQFNRTERSLLRRLDAVVVIAEPQRRYLIETEHLDPANFELIPNGIDTDRFSPRPELRAGARAALRLSDADFAIGIVASLTPEKAHRVLIDAVARLHADGLPLKLVIAGEGGERPNIEAAIANAGLSDSIHMLGLRRDLDRAVYPALDLLTLVSHPFRETLPVSVLEGMACGLAVVATRVGSVSDLVVDGLNGRLVPPGDPAALADAIREVALDPARRAAFGRAGRERVLARFTLDRMMTAYAERIPKVDAAQPGFRHIDAHPKVLRQK
jgi:glycosyltransferase involved in cell wall biosynthesis